MRFRLGLGGLVVLIGLAGNAAVSAAPSGASVQEVTVSASKTDPQAPFLPDVQGTKIYAGKKTSVTRLKDAPAITNNNYRQALVKVPGVLLSEETTPLFSLGYRGLNPDRAQFMQVMKDGIPIAADMFGYPESYYTPLLQTVDRIEFIRGGSALMYGPQPGGALNYVTQKPPVDRALVARSENAFGTDHYFSTYESVSGSAGPVGYLGYFHERQGDGFRRANSDFEVLSGGMKVTINQTGDKRLTLNYEEYFEQHGEPGGLSLTATTNPTYHQDRNFTTREFDRFRLERRQASLIYEHEFSEKTQFDFRLYGGNYRRWSRRQRGGGFGTVPTGAAANSNDVQEQNFYTLGFEPRLRRHYEWLGGDHTLTAGTHTYFSKSPRIDARGASPMADTGTIFNENNRYMRYLSFFAENLFRWGNLSVTPGVRWENYWQRIEEHANVNRADLTDRQTFDSVPLFGLGLAYDIAKAVTVYSNITQSYRPQLFAESVPTGASQTVDQDLQEGFAWQYDFGVRGKPVPFFSWDVDYFLIDFRDQIGTSGNSVENVGDARHHGIELAMEADVVGFWDFLNRSELGKEIGSLSPFIAWTLLDAEFYKGPNEGRAPAFAPKSNLRFGVQQNWRDRVKTALTSTFVSDHFADDSSTLNRKVPSYKVWDLTAEVLLVKDLVKALDLSVFGGINNLFDEEYYSRITGSGIDPAYERNIYGGFKLSLGTPSRWIGAEPGAADLNQGGYAG
ncbi:MAG: TonB-dependent receptor [Candidatus Omnitrophica bacterium]|nr:TonB-dependent receptor [Candidatus Omnitrophota bacterium]